MTSRFSVLAGFALAACGGSGSSGGSGSVDGTVRGQPVAIVEAASAAVSSTTGSASEAMILMSSTTGLCVAPSAVVNHPGEKVVMIILSDSNGTMTNAPTAPGTYTVGTASLTPAKAAVFEVNVLNATCGNDSSLGSVATAGTVTLTSVDGGAFAGTYDVTLDTGEHVTGSFDPDACSTLADEVHSNGTPPCQP